MRGADALIAALERHGADTVFGVPGGAALPLYDALASSGIRHVLTRHEAAAVRVESVDVTSAIRLPFDGGSVVLGPGPRVVLLQSSRFCAGAPPPSLGPSGFGGITGTF